MAIIDFPLSPSVGQLYFKNGITWTWTGVSWDIYNNYPDTPIHLKYNTITSLLNDQENQYSKFIYFVNENNTYYEKLETNNGSILDYNVIRGEINEDKHIKMYINTPQNIWNFQHNLGKYPSVITYDSSNRRIYGYEEIIDINNYRITFSSSISGYATFN